MNTPAAPRRLTRRLPALALCALALAALPLHAAEAAVQAFAPDFFKAFQVSTALDMVRHLPGFTLDEGSAQRGVDGAQGNVLINGKRPASGAATLPESLARIPAASVRAVELIHGGANGIDMQGQATVANIVLVDSDLVALSTSVTSVMLADGSTHPALDASYSLRRRGHSVDVSVGWGDWPELSAGSGVRTTRRSGAAQDDTVALRKSAGAQRGALKINYGQDLLGGQLNWNGVFKPWTYRALAQYDGQQHVAQADDNSGREREQGLGFSRALGPSSKLEVRALLRTSDSMNSAQSESDGERSQYRSATAASEQILFGQLNFQPAPRWAIRGTIEHSVNTSENASAYQAKGMAVALPAAASVIEEERAHGDLWSEWRLSRAMALDAGLKLERSTLSQRGAAAGPSSFFYPRPRLRLSLSPSDALQLRVRLEREVGQLNYGDFVSSIALQDRTVTAGNPDLVPARSWRSEGTLEYRFLGRGAAMLSYAHTRISDVVDRVPLRTADALLDAAGNIGDASADSVSGQLTVPTDKLLVPLGLIKLSTTWRASEVTDPTTLARRRLSGEQPLAWRLEFSQDLPLRRASWGLSLDNGWSNSSWRVAERADSAGSGWAQAFVNYRPAPALTVALELKNLASRTTSYERTHYAPERSSGTVDLVERNLSHSQPVAQLSLRRDW